MPSELSTLLPIVSIVITLCALIGAVVVYRGNSGKGLSEVQEKAISALTSQTETQEQQIKALEKKVIHLNRVVLTIGYALKRRGLRIEVDDEAITLIDEHTKAHQTMQIRVLDALPEDDKGA